MLEAWSGSLGSKPRSFWVLVFFLSSLDHNPTNEMKGFFCETRTQACLKQLNYVSFIQVLHKLTTFMSLGFQAGTKTHWPYSLVEIWKFTQHLVNAYYWTNKNVTDMPLISLATEILTIGYVQGDHLPLRFKSHWDKVSLSWVSKSWQIIYLELFRKVLVNFLLL